MIFTDKELAYLKTQTLGRLATVGPGGVPQVVPVGFTLNNDGTIDIGGPGLSTSLKWRNLEGNPNVAIVIDDMTPDEPDAVAPGWGRGVEVRGQAELIKGQRPAYGNPEFFSDETIRIHPRRILSWHLDRDQLRFTRSVVQASA